MKVVSWNVRRGKETTFALGAAQIVGLRPDIILLQEVFRPAPGSATAGVDQAFAQLLDGFAVHFPTVQEPGGTYGQSIVSRVPIIASGQIALPTGSRQEPRCCGWVETAAGGFATVHLSTGPPEQQLMQLDCAGQELPATVSVLAGDLNYCPDALAGWTLHRNHGRVNLPTWPTKQPRKVLDHVMSRGTVSVRGTQVLPIPGSDHLPVIFDVTQTV